VRIGLDAVIELVKLREPCYKLTALDPRMPAAVAGRVGFMARVVESGVVRVGDAVAGL
jgi:MOSC domain-containing protein YiiM